jgi:hypothetical protein
MTESSNPERTLSDIASKLLFENDRVRIWELRMEPGTTGPVHRHDLDHVLIQISGDRMAVVPEPDSQSIYKDYLEADVFPGNWFYVEKGGIEAARNVGKEPFHEIIVELKD